MHQQLFSDELEEWLLTNESKTLESINEVFGEKSFGLVFLVLLSLSAAPLPTGGITHVLELLAMFFAVQMIMGRKHLWIPKMLRTIKLPKSTEDKFIPYILKRVRRVEKRSKSTKRGFLKNTNVLRFCGIIIFIFTLGAFVSPPFSGLDTLPSLGVVVMALAILLNDLRLYVAGLAIGIIGLIIIAGLVSLVFNPFINLFSTCLF